MAVELAVAGGIFLVSVPCGVAQLERVVHLGVDDSIATVGICVVTQNILIGHS